MTVPRVLVIAGSDSSGGAGIEADSRVLATHGVYSMTATTALTIQNTLGVQDVIVTPPEAVGRMIRANLDDIGCDAVKIGMLASAETIKAVSQTLQDFNVQTIVLDPVMVSTSGSQLLPQDAVRNLREMLIPQSTLVTPNIPEATLLLRDANIDYKPISNLSDLELLAKQVHSLGCKAVLLKGGHLPFTKSHTKAETDDEKHLTIDILYDGDTLTTIESPYITSTSTHGTGCSLASAITAHLAQHEPLIPSVRSSIRYVTTGIKTACRLGHGSGPINHFHTLQTQPFSNGHFLEHILSHPKVTTIWNSFIHHAFATSLGRNTLPLRQFKSYLIQDYKYLVHFARSHALAGYKSAVASDVFASSALAAAVQAEMALHLSYCADLGVSRRDLDQTPESLACVAYSRYILDVGVREDWLALQVALLPCLVGYRVVAERLMTDSLSVRGEENGNRCWRWVENYGGREYGEVVRKGVGVVEERVGSAGLGRNRVEELVEIFVRATEMEVRFWDEALVQDK